MSDEAWTLSLLLDELSPYMSQLSVLDHLYTHGIEACSSISSESYKASHLLEEIFRTLTSLSNFGNDHHQLV